jgi:hypothetical protein
MTDNGLLLIDSALNEFRMERDTQQKERRLEDKEEQKRLNDLMIIENRFAPVKQKFLDKIFQWRDGFIKTDEFRGIYNIKTFSHLDIFGGRWGHKIPYCRNYGCWSRLNLERDGSLIYLAGYKYMGTSDRFDLEKDIEIFSPVYVKELCVHIKSGKVYSFIAEEIKRFSQFC